MTRAQVRVGLHRGSVCGRGAHRGKGGREVRDGDGETLDQLLARLNPMFFDPAVDPLVTAKTPERGMDILSASANNLYEDVSMKDLAGFREEFPLNSRLVKRDGW